ncbi:MAG: GNAT family N-acetyltransferase [Dehalococcoidia bacterium]
MAGDDVEITEEANLERAWPELRGLLRELIDYHEPLTGQKLSPDWEEHIKAEMAPVLSTGSGLLLFVRAGGRAMGFLSGHVTETTDTIFEGKLGNIDNVYLKPDLRGRRIGSRLVDAAEAWLRKQGASEIELNVIVANELGRDVWQALGYEPFSERRRKRLF